MRKYVSLKILRSTSFVIIHCYLSSGVLLGLRIVALFNELWFYKKDRIIKLQPRNFHTSPLFKENFFSKFQEKTCLENILFASKFLNNLIPPFFSTWFSFSSDQHICETSSSTHGNLTKLFHKTNKYEKYSITVSAAESWNKIQKQVKDMLLKEIFLRKIKEVVSNSYLKSY